MSLFKWSTPERRDLNSQMLPIVPNEIYFEIFGHIAPSTEYLTEEQIRIFTRLSLVCRFFANFCLPRIFEHVEFSGSIFRDDTPSVAVYNDTVPYRTSRETTLCAQLAAKQPLALALAQKVKVCHFTNWELDDNGSWAVQLFAKKYITGMVHMKYIRQLEFSNSYVDAEHWAAIATLKALEDLYFDQCQFLQGPADDKPENRIQLKVARLQVTECDGHRQPFAAVDVEHLRTLVVDFLALDSIDWLSQSTLTEIRIYPGRPSCLDDGRYIERVHGMLMDAPKSVEALWLPLCIGVRSPRGVVRSIFDDPEMKIPPLLRSLTLRVTSHSSNILHDLSLALDGAGLITGLQSLRITLENKRPFQQTSYADIRYILHENFGVTSSLRYIDIDGKAFRLMDGEWSEVPCHAAG